VDEFRGLGFAALGVQSLPEAFEISEIAGQLFRLSILGHRANDEASRLRSDLGLEDASQTRSFVGVGDPPRDPDRVAHR